MNDNMTKEQEAQYIAALQQEASKMGLDPNNEAHLGAVKSALQEMQRLQVTDYDSPETVHAKMQERLEVAKVLNVDTQSFEAQQNQTKTDAETIAKQSKTRGIINLVIALVAGAGAAFLTNRAGTNREWKSGWKWTANIGAFLGAGAGATLLGSRFLMGSLQKKTEESMQALQTVGVDLDKRLYTAIAQHFVKDIEAEHAQAAAAEQAKQKQQVTDQTPPQAQPAPAKSEAEIIADAKNKEEIAKEVDEGREVTYKSGKHADGLAPTDLKDRVVSRGGSHIDAAAEQQKVAATQQHTMV